MLEVSFGRNRILQLYDLEYRVRRYSWTWIGGPETAEIEAYGGNYEQALGLLGADISISYLGDVVWSGLVETVTAPMGSATVTWDLRPVLNYIVVRYSAEDSTWRGKITVQDTASQNLWGLRVGEIQASAQNKSTAQNKANTFLAFLKDPRVTIEHRRSDRASLICYGRVVGLGSRRYWYTNYTTAQTLTDIIATILGNLVDSVAYDSSLFAGQPTRRMLVRHPFRADKWLEDLSTQVFGDGRRALPQVVPTLPTQPSVATILAEPSPGSGLTVVVANDGTLRTIQGAEIPAPTLTVGYWLLPEAALTRYWGGDRRYVSMVERAEFDAQSWRWTWTAKQLEDPLRRLGGRMG